LLQIEDIAVIYIRVCYNIRVGTKGTTATRKLN
jgi:hypothetical protein